jgi:hypothetical protein
MSNYFDNKPVFMEPQVNQYSSHMVMTNVSQEIKSKIVNIDTKFRDDFNNDTSSVVDYNITLPENINNVCSITVENMELPITFYNISSTLENNVFKVTVFVDGVEGDTKIITVADGEYTKASLQAALNDAMDQAYPSTFHRLTFDMSDDKANFYVNQIDMINEYHYVVDFAVDKNGNFDKFNIKSKLGWILGYTQLTYDTRASNLPTNSLTFPIIRSEMFTNLSSSRVLYLSIDEFSQTKQNSFYTMMARSRNSNNIISKICINRNTSSFGSIFVANKANGYLLSDIRNYNGKCDIKRLRIQIIDEFDRKVNLNGIDFSFSLKIDYI